ncbi:RsmB/NOP family class I SAM-dependent RNA methyltransferase [Phenylobacterium sp.]|uniref:RsmB/NOP family class I SAM-dependent RNA methyltransferase n=1 Tax=Phenylobacterium sp. TaxID=1871053 RepID=UPI002CD5C4B0|nr:RsmB/NOP family class I SAM-dependent RNA methyltransferase [Phenylobacterium sp.]HLZ74304.1 RsmB/NOP family class I SAM-dependent RNA methyltransferase [Phenylobacterium sp.]
MTDISSQATPNDAPLRDVGGLPARAAALDLLTAALSGRAGMDEGLSHPALAALDGRDRAFARALVMATLRHLGPIDSALQARVKKPPPDKVVQILRLGVAQAFVLKTPAHAAVTTSVDLVAQDRSLQMFKGLVNAVLRGLLREPPQLDDPESMAPSWLYARWRSAFGPDEARKIAAVIAQEPATDLSLKDPARGEALAAKLEAKVLPGGTLRTERRGDLATWPEFAEGAWWVQDASAAIPARLLGVRAGETALDMCAAPGGKTLQLAAAGAKTVALDRSAVRLKRVAENLARMELTAEVAATDAATWPDKRSFDAVLLDAPCSATGTFRRHPDVLWAAKPSDVAGMAAVQSKLLDAAARRTKAGGRLVYCVCSLEPEEGEGQVAAFLGRTPGMTLDPIAAGEGGAPDASVRRDGTLRILPHHIEGGTDGFYVARFRKA